MRTNFNAQVAAIAATARTCDLDLAACNDVTLQGRQPAIHAHGLRSRGGARAGFRAFAIERSLQLRGYRRTHRENSTKSALMVPIDNSGYDAFRQL
jgi:hypothetical protein